MVNEDSNASFPSPAPPSDDSQGADDSLQSFPDKQKERKRTNSGGNGMYANGILNFNKFFDFW